MKVLTVKQPWASFIAHGIKDIENRTWKTNFRGRVLIHAGQALCRKSIFETLNFEQYSAFREKVGFSGLDFSEPKGAIIGSVEIVDCVINHPSVWAEKTKVITDHSDGVPTPCYDVITYNWVLANPVLFDEPIQGVKGKLSFWEYPIAKVVPIDNLCRICGYFTSQTDANNHYGCTHPEQSETDPCTEINGYYAYDKHGATQMGKCYSFSCPLATECDLEDLRDHSKDYYDEWKNKPSDPAEAGAQLMLVFDKDLISKL